MRFVSSVAIYLGLLMTMNIVSRASSFVTSRRINAASTSMVWNRLFLSSRQAKLTTQDDDNNNNNNNIKNNNNNNNSNNCDTWTTSSLTRTEIRKLKVGSLRDELAKRGLDGTGIRSALLSRLLETTTAPPTRTTTLQVSSSSWSPEHEPQASCEAAAYTPLLLDPDRTYVLRVTCHKRSVYVSSGAGLVLYDAQSVREVWTARKYFPKRMTPCEAEYRAIIAGLEHALKTGVTKIVLQTDNQVLARQLGGEFRVTKVPVQALYQLAAHKMLQFQEFRTTHISAAENTRAKNLAQRAVDTKTSVGLPPEEDEPTTTTMTTPDETKSFMSIPQQQQQQVPLSEEKKETTNVLSPETTYLLRFDGGARGNPGPAGGGMVLYNDDMHEVWCGWKYFGDCHTNNVAEYNSLLLGLQCAKSLGITKLRVEGDSLLIVRQLKGIYRVKEPRLKPIFQACQDVIHTFHVFEVEHIPRAENSRADQLANQAMDTKQSFGFEEVY